MEDRLFQELLEATREAVAHYKGAKRDLRSTILPDPPRPMSRAEVRRLREKLKVSQAVFANCLNVSTKLVQAWEGGFRYPDGAALRLLRVAEQAPALVFGVRGGAAGAKRRSKVRRGKKVRVA